MNMAVKAVKREAAARHLPIAHGVEKDRKVALESEHAEQRRKSETRLQAAVAVARDARDERDPYADVPCTD